MGGPAIKVFIVDDSVAVCERIKNMLSELPGIKVAGQAHTRREALDCIKELHPDVVILDIRMPGGSGIDVLKNIKNDQPSPRVIVFTNYPYPQYRKKCMDEGAELFLDKSREFKKLIEILRQWGKSNAK